MSSHYYCDCGKRWHDDESCPACHPDDFIEVDEYNLVCDQKRKLKSQLAIAVEALKKIEDPRLRDHKEPDKYTEVGCVINMAAEALAKIEAKRHQKLSKVLDEDDGLAK